MYDVVIIGSGPAGLSASIYAKRASMGEVLFNLVSENKKWQYLRKKHQNLKKICVVRI